MNTTASAAQHTAGKIACINIRNADGSGAGCTALPGSLVELWDEKNERICLVHAADIVALAHAKWLEDEAKADKQLEAIFNPKRRNGITCACGAYFGWMKHYQHHLKTCEAGTVASETGCTPRQLLAQRDELLAALEGVLSRFAREYDALTEGSHGLIDGYQEVRKARAAIRSAKPE